MDSMLKSGGIDKDKWNSDIFAENSDLLLPSDQLIKSILKEQVGSSADFEGVKNIERSGSCRNGNSIIFPMIQKITR